MEKTSEFDPFVVFVDLLLLFDLLSFNDFLCDDKKRATDIYLEDAINHGGTKDNIFFLTYEFLDSFLLAVFNSSGRKIK